jgi:hypothetical protein
MGAATHPITDAIWREALAPELALTLSEWTDRHRISPPTSAGPGPWRWLELWWPGQDRNQQPDRYERDAFYSMMLSIVY